MFHSPGRPAIPENPQPAASETPKEAAPGSARQQGNGDRVCRDYALWQLWMNRHSRSADLLDYPALISDVCTYKNAGEEVVLCG